jgi:flagellar biosynthesis/type III secretory pathway protein FliH
MEGRWPSAGTARRDCRRGGRGRQEGLQEGRQEGLEQGLLRGERVLLHKQLERRYGALPTWVSERLAQADHAQLEAWALDLLDAANLEDIFPAG